jgi:hypothetical protein
MATLATVARIKAAAATTCAVTGVSSSVAAHASKELKSILQTALLARYALTKKCSDRSATAHTKALAMFPTAVETALVEASLAVDNIRDGDATLTVKPLPSASTLYHTFMVERYKFSLGYNRAGATARLAALWSREVEFSGSEFRLHGRYEESELSNVLAVPTVGHAALGSMLADAFDLLRDVIGIKEVWLSSGSLLGAIRKGQHGGSCKEVRASSFIPWDDDLDITITRQEEMKLLAFFGLMDTTGPIADGATSATASLFEYCHNERHWVIEHCPLFGYKLYDKNCHVPLGCDELLERGAMCFGAFVDIFVVEPVPCDESRLQLNRRAARGTWPREVYDKSATFPLKTVNFSYPTSCGDIVETALLAPRCPEVYLDSLYGCAWATDAIVPQQLHYGLVLPSELRIAQASFLIC